MNFHIGGEVKKGDVLFRLDTERIDNEIAKANRRLAAEREEAVRLESLLRLSREAHEVAKAKAEADLARATQEHESELGTARRELERAQEEEERMRGLVRAEALPHGDLDRAIARRQDAEAKLSAAESRTVEATRRQRDLIDKENALRLEELELRLTAKRADASTDEKEIANLGLERSHAVVCAHVDGVVVAGELNVGDMVQPGKAVVSIAQQKGFRIDLAVSSADIGSIRVGMKARVKLDAYDYQRYGTLRGSVMSVSPDSQAQDGRVFYVVKISLEDREVARGELRGSVKLGMTGTVEIETRRESLLSVLGRRIRNTISMN